MTDLHSQQPSKYTSSVMLSDSMRLLLDILL